MKRVIELGIVIGSALAGCASDGDPADPAGTAEPSPDPAVTDPVVVTPGGSGATADPSPTQQAPALPPPSTAYAGSSTVAVISRAAGGGGGIHIHGGSEGGAFAFASYQIPVSGSRATAQLTVDPAPGAAFVYTLMGSGSGYSTRKLVLKRVPGSSQLQATSATGQVLCGALADAPTAVTLVLDGQARTFDVRIAGAATACTGLATLLQAPATGFMVMDASNPGYGGDVTFTELALF